MKNPNYSMTPGIGCERCEGTRGATHKIVFKDPFGSGRERIPSCDPCHDPTVQEINQSFVDGGRGVPHISREDLR